jgi:hypothetical protein
MKYVKKVTVYPSGDSIKLIEGVVFDYKYLLHKLFQASVDPFVQAGNRRNTGSELTGEVYLQPVEELEPKPSFIPVQESYDLFTLKNYCDLVEQKALLIKKIKSRSDVYLVSNNSMLRNMVIHALGLVLSIVAAVIYRHIAAVSATGIDWFGIVFKSISIYLCVSIFYQSLKAFGNTIISKQDLLFWKKTTVGLLDDKEYNRYIAAPLTGLKRSLFVTYPFIVMVYVCLSYYSYKLPNLLQNTTFSLL